MRYQILKRDPGLNSNHTSRLFDVNALVCQIAFSEFASASNYRVSFEPCLVWLGLVYCGLKSYSAIFQLYSDGTVVQFLNLDLLPGTHRHGQLGVFSMHVLSLPQHGPWTSEDVIKFSFLPLESPHAMRARWEWNSPDPQSARVHATGVEINTFNLLAHPTCSV